MTVEEKIISHIEQNCTYPDGSPMMDEQTFYEGAKWGYSEAMIWRDPNKELPDYYKKVQLKVKHNGKLDYVNACLLVDDDGGFFFCDYNYGIYVQFKHVIGWKPIE